VTTPAQNPVTFDNPAPLGGNEPRPRDLIGRTVFIQPTLIERAPKLGTKTGETEDRITANITVIDGGPLQFGGAPEKQPTVPHTMTVAVPYTATDVYISQTNMVKACKRSLPSAARPQGGVVVGFIEFGKQNDPTKNAPINLTELAPTDPRRIVAGQVLNSIISGTFINPQPVEIVAAGAPAAPAMDPQYAAYLAAQAQQAAAGAPVVQPPAPPMDPGYAAYLAAQQAAAATVAAPTIPAPPGWAPEVWKSLTVAQQQSIVGQAAAPAGTPPL
jgi:hypothetical protein